MNTKILALTASLAALALSGSANAAEPSKGTTTNNVSLDGYCNVLQVTVFAWHQAGTIETGCESERVGVGMEGKVKGASWKGKTLTIGENPGGSGMYLYNIQYPLVTGGGWSIYSTSDGVNFNYVNSGTYTVTEPGAKRSGPPADFVVRK